MASTQLGCDKPQGDDKLPVRLNVDGTGDGERSDGPDGPEDYSVERVEKVYR